MRIMRFDVLAGSIRHRAVLPAPIREIIPEAARRAGRHAIEYQGGQLALRRLDRHRPGLRRLLQSAVRYRAELGPAFARYSDGISSVPAAVSVETAAVLQALCGFLRPSAIVDLGSGFSTYVLAKYASSHDARVVSVDDDQYWTGKAAAFLHSEGITAPVEFIGTSELPRYRAMFDFSFYDIGDMTARLATLPSALDLLKPHGVMILDDAHKETVEAEYRRVIEDRSWSVYSLSSVTMDQWGRFALIALGDSWRRS